MTPPIWCLDYVGLPFEDHGRGAAVDCWGLVCRIYKEKRGIDLPDYAGAYLSSADRNSVSTAVEEGCRSWEKVRVPQELDVVIIRLAGRPWHCGVIVGEDWMLHALDSVGSVLERPSSPLWRNRIEGYYRHE